MPDVLALAAELGSNDTVAGLFFLAVMPRIRTVKPEFWQDEKLAGLDPLTRLVFLGLISMADDGGRLVDSVKLIDGFVFPDTTDTCKGALEILARLSRVCRYVSGSGQRLLQITKWDRHQLISHPSKYTLPAPSHEDLIPQEVIKSSGNPPESLKPSSGDPPASTYDLRPTTNDQRSKDSSLLTPEEQAVVDHYKHCHPRRLRGDLPSRTRKLLRNALKSYSVQDLNDAIDHNAASTFHREHNFMGLELILRDSEKIDFFLGLRPEINGKHKESDDIYDRVARQFEAQENHAN